MIRVRCGTLELGEIQKYIYDEKLKTLLKYIENVEPQTSNIKMGTFFNVIVVVKKHTDISHPCN